MLLRSISLVLLMCCSSLSEGSSDGSDEELGLDEELFLGLFLEPFSVFLSSKILLESLAVE